MVELDIVDWCDFVRGVVDSETEQQMRRQLETAQTSVASTVVMLQRVAETGRSEAENALPSHAIRIAKAIASCPRKESASPVPKRSLLRRLVCSVTFDSLLQPAPAGTRNLAADHRQLFMEAGGYRVDLQLEHELEPSSTVAVGQVMSATNVHRDFSRIPVLIFSGENQISQTLTSPHGEFQFEGLPREALELCMVIGEDFLEIPVPIGSETPGETP